MTRRSKHSKDVNLALTVVLSGVVVALVILFSVGRDNSTSRVDPDGIDVKVEDILVKSSEIISGSISGIPYYHCAGSEKDLVLLHGAAFSKENWNSSGILSGFCINAKLSVSALDLPVSAGHEQLKSLLLTMEDSGLIKRPVVLVTPSASGKTITDWMLTGDVAEIPKYVSKWIPVAAGSVARASDVQVSSLRGNLPTLAIYGSRDTAGKLVSEKLVDLAGANILEIDGGHPAYLDSPLEFVEGILLYLGLDS
jgi:hypothetical protein